MRMNAGNVFGGQRLDICFFRVLFRSLLNSPHPSNETIFSAHSSTANRQQEVIQKREKFIGITAVCQFIPRLTGRRVFGLKYPAAKCPLSSRVGIPTASPGFASGIMPGGKPTAVIVSTQSVIFGFLTKKDQAFSPGVADQIQPATSPGFINGASVVEWYHAEGSRPGFTRRVCRLAAGRNVLLAI